jgi:hypothetical protein
MNDAIHSNISPAALIYGCGLSLGSIKLCKAQYVTQLIKKNMPIEIGGIGTLTFMVIRDINLM